MLGVVFVLFGLYLIAPAKDEAREYVPPSPKARAVSAELAISTELATPPPAMHTRPAAVTGVSHNASPAKSSGTTASRRATRAEKFWDSAAPKDSAGSPPLADDSDYGSGASEETPASV